MLPQGHFTEAAIFYSRMCGTENTAGTVGTRASVPAKVPVLPTLTFVPQVQT